MPDPDVNNAERRSFFKWSLLSTAAFAAAVSGFGAAVLSKDAESKVTNLNDAATVVTDASKNVHCRLKTTQDFHLANPVNAVDGQRIIWEIIQDGIGGRRMSLDDKFVFGGDLTKAELSTVPNKRDFLTAIYNQPADQWHVVAFIRGY